MELKIPMPWGYLAGRSYGSWGGTPVLAIHSWKDNCGSFGVIGPLISKEIFLVAIDLPGHGKSSHLPPGIPYHRVDFAPILKRVVDHQRWKKVTIVGHGVGAELAILFTAAFPNHVDKLILIDEIKPASVSFVNRAQFLAGAIDEQIDNDEKVEESQDSRKFNYDEGIAREIESSNGELSEDAAKLLFERGSTNTGEGEWKLSSDIRLSCPDTLVFSHEQIMNLIEGLTGIPVLYIKTNKVGLDPEEEGLKRAVIEVYKRICKPFNEVEVNGGHYVQMTHPNDVVAAIEEFVLY